MTMSMRWYVVHAYSGQEKSIQQALIERIRRSGMADKFGQVLVPTEEVVEMKSGQKAISERRFFPGYILVQMDMTDETWHLVKSTPKVTGFIGGSAMRPTPISDKEVAFAEEVAAKMREKGIRVDIDSRVEKLGHKIREAELKKIPYMAVIGGKEKEAGTLSIRSKKKGDLGKLPVDQFVEQLQKEIESRSLT